MRKRLRLRLLLLAITTTVFIFAFTACGKNDTAEYPIVASESLINEGLVVYAENCASCHGDKDTSPPFPSAPPHTINGHTWEHADRALVDMVLNGGSIFQTMPRFKETLSEEEVQATIAYIKTFWPLEVIERQTEVSAEYEAQFAP